MNRWLETDTQKTARSIINVLNESAAGMVKKEINKDKPEEAPKNKKVALEKRITKAAIKGKKPESKNAKMPKKIAKKVVKEELEPEVGNSIEDQIADLQDYLNNTPEVSDEERAEIQAEIDDLISQLGEKDLELNESIDVDKYVNEDKEFKYQLLSRLQSDCDYFLGVGNRAEKHLWANNVEDQTALMKALYNSFSEEDKPEWITLDKIEEYEKEMKDNTLEEDLNAEKQNSNFSKSQAILPLNNYQAMGIIISDDGETVQYMYSNDENDNMYEAEIEYDEDGNPYFVDKEGTSWEINDFMRTNYGLQEASFSDKVSAIKKSLKKKDKRLSDKTAEQSAKNIAGAMAKKESMKEEYSEKFGRDPKDFISDLISVKYQLSKLNLDGFGSHLARQMVEDFIDTCDRQIEKAKRLASRDEFYTEALAMEEPLDLVAYEPEITSTDEVKDKYVKIRGDFHKVIDVKPEGDKFVISFAAGTGTAIGGEFEPATLDEIKRLQLYTENKKEAINEEVTYKTREDYENEDEYNAALEDDINTLTNNLTETQKAMNTVKYKEFVDDVLKQIEEKE